MPLKLKLRLVAKITYNLKSKIFYHFKKVCGIIFKQDEKPTVYVDIDVHRILDAISGYYYVISKFDVPYMPNDFPVHYPINKDIDILCIESDYDNIVTCILKCVEIYKDKVLIKTVKKNFGKREYRTLIRVELKKRLLIQFDISFILLKTKNNFMDEFINNRIKKDCFYIPSLEFEYLIRLIEVSEHPNKKHHFEYIQFHKNDLNNNLCDQFLDFNWKQYCGGKL